MIPALVSVRSEARSLKRIQRQGELLICCARTSMDSGTAKKLRRLAEQISDWQSLISSAEEHGVLPLMYWNLGAVCSETVPGDVFQHLKEQFDRNLHRNFLLSAALIKLLDNFEAQGVRAVALKGPVLDVLVGLQPRQPNHVAGQVRSARRLAVEPRNTEDETRFSPHGLPNQN